MIDFDALPNDNLRDAMRRYVEDGIPPGSFLGAVLCNDLMEACIRADDYNRHRIYDIVQWLYAEAPALCHGSPAKMQAWMSARSRPGGRLTNDNL